MMSLLARPSVLVNGGFFGGSVKKLKVDWQLLIDKLIGKCSPPWQIAAAVKVCLGEL